MPPIPPRYSALQAYEPVDEKDDIQPLLVDDERFPRDGQLAYDDDDLRDGAAFFSSAARATKRHRTITFAFLAAFATLYALLFGSVPSLGLSDMLSDIRAQLYRAHGPCPHAAGIRGYQDTLDNLESFNPTPVSASHGKDSDRPADWLPDSLRALEAKFLQVPKADGAREALKRYTENVHIAGTPEDYKLSSRLLDEWAGLLGIELPQDRKKAVFDAGSSESRDHVYGRGSATGPRAWTDTYSIYLNYALNSSLTLSKAPSDQDPTREPYFTAALKEDVIDEDPSTSKGARVFHAYSASGAASGQLVYAGMGRKEDFEGLAAKGIDVKGKVVLVTYGGVFRGLKVRAAQEAGAVACLIYTDPIEDGEVTVDNGYEAYPDGPARHPSAIQRGSVQALSFYPGDPGTPGKPSYRNATRIAPEAADSLPKIPSLPLSYRDARPLLESLRGKGVLAKDVNKRMPGALSGIEYWTGPSEDVAHVENFGDLQVRDIWNTYAVLPGTVSDEVVVLGNHIDSHGFGAADPNSGTAAFHEMIKGLGELYKAGWRPLRTIMLAAWDAEEYGLVGSTEFGEDYADWIKENVVVYHNADVAVAGSSLRGHASPSLSGHLKAAVAEVADPNKDNGSHSNLTAVTPLGSGSDFTVFLQYLGVASTDVGFTPSVANKDPIYMYHSNMDSFHWMEKFGDPGFKRHEAAAKVLGISAIRTAAPLFSPINVTAYALQLEEYLEKVEKLVDKANLGGDGSVNLKGVKRALRKVHHAAVFVGKERAVLEKAIAKLLERRSSSSKHHHGHRALRKLLDRVRRLNQNVRIFEQGFIDPAGLPGRTWYRHLGVAPGRWLGYGATTLPGLTESITLDGGKGAQHEADRLERHFKAMADRLYRQ